MVFPTLGVSPVHLLLWLRTSSTQKLSIMSHIHCFGGVTENMAEQMCHLNSIRVLGLEKMLS